MADYSLAGPVAELLAEWEERWSNGEPVTPEELCRGHPELLESLRDAIYRLGQADALLEISRRCPADSTPSTGGLSGAMGVESQLAETAFRDGGDSEGAPVGHARRNDFSQVDRVWIKSDYEQPEPFDRGGMGEVFVATDRQLGRQVAVKLIRPQRAGDAISEKQFLREAEITGRLDHPGIVPIHGVGQADDGRPCYTMRFVKGKTPLSIRPDIPRPLDAICRKAMSREIANRYATATELAQDIDRWLADEPVTAYRQSIVERGQRLLHKHAARFASAAVVLVLGLLASLAFASQAIRHSAQLRLESDKVRDTNEKLGRTNKKLDAARREAEDRLRSARTIVDSSFTRISGYSLLGMPRFAELRKSMLAFQAFQACRGWRW